MSYRGALLRRWSRRDVLAVLVVAASVAFITGAGVVSHAATTEMAGVAAEFETPASVDSYDDHATARRAADDGDVVLVLARATLADGRTVTVVGVPRDARSLGDDSEMVLPAQPPAGELRGPVTSARSVEFDGTAGALSATVEPRTSPTSLPGRWYVGSVSTAERLGPTSALVVSPGEGATPVVGVLSFFLAGSRQVLRSLGLATVAAGLLVGVTVFATTRMTVRDRLRTIRVVRATGGRPRTVLSLFGARAGLQTVVGVAAGYAVGVVVPNAAVNAAVFLGRPTSLALRVGEPLVALLVPAYVALVGVGVLGGMLAAVPMVRRPPARLTGRAPAGDGAIAGPQDGVVVGPEWVQPDLLDWRAVVPTGATLGVFLVVAVLVASTAGVVAPLAGGDGATVTQPGAAHPVASTVPASYATELRVAGVAASPEILALGVTDGQPYVARGANFTAFASVTDASVATGRAPDGPGEAVVGADLARTLGLRVGESVVVGGSTSPAVDRLRVVGVFEAPEPFDDQLVVPLSTARALAGRGQGQVHFVRTAERPTVDEELGVVVGSVEAPSSVPAGGALTVAVTVFNPTDRNLTTEVRATMDGASAETTVELAPGRRRTVRLSLPADEPGSTTLSVAGRERSVSVVDPDSLQLEDLPTTAPTGSEPLVRVVTAAGDPVEGATVTAGDRTVTTGTGGWTRLPLEDSGTVTVVATAADRRTNRSLDVRDGAARRPVTALVVTPETPTPATRPTARIGLRNPWNESLTVPLAVSGPGGSHTRAVTLPAGNRSTVTIPLARRPAGEYDVSVESGDAQLARTTYEVRGDPRLSAALATSGRRGATTGVGQALSIVLGNVELLIATMLGLAAVMTVGGTTAAFASAVHARRRTLGIHRAVGATPRQVLGMVGRDATRIGLVSTAVGLALAGLTLAALDAAGLLVVFGVRVLSTVDPAVVLVVAASAFCLALLGALLATLGVLRTSPGRLVSGATERPTTGGAQRE